MTKLSKRFSNELNSPSKLPLEKTVDKVVPLRKKYYNNYSLIYSKNERWNIAREIITSSSKLSKAVSEISKRNNIPPSTLRYWVKKFNIPIKRGLKRRSGGGKKPVISYAKELELYNWLISLREKNIQVTVPLFLAKAKNSIQGDDDDFRGPLNNFKCSKGWLVRYCYRWKLSIRHADNVSPAKLVQGIYCHYPSDSKSLLTF